MEQTTPLLYTPAVAPQQPPQASEYVLVDDVTHKPSPKRGQCIITIPVKNDNGKSTTMQIQVPHLPISGCSRCYGRGYIGMDTISGKAMLCQRCYRGREIA